MADLVALNKVPVKAVPAPKPEPKMVNFDPVILTQVALLKALSEEIGKYADDSVPQRGGVAAKLALFCTQMIVVCENILKNEPMEEGAQIKLIAALYKDIEKFPELIAKAMNRSLEEASQPEIDGKPNTMLPIFADLAVVHEVIQVRMYELGLGEQGFADKKPIIYPHPALFGSSIALAGLAYMMGAGFFGALKQINDTPNNLVKAELLAENNPENPGEPNLKWVNKTGKPQAYTENLKVMQPLKEGVVAQQMSNEYRESTTHNMKTAVLFVGSFFSGLVAAAFAIKSLERENMGKKHRFDPYLKIHHRLNEKNNGLHSYRRSEAQAER